MSGSRAGSLREEQKALTRRRLLDSAEAVFARRGFAGATVEEIARDAGASTGAVYSNFQGKEDLFLALFEERMATDVGDYSNIVSDDASMEQQLRGAGDHWMAILRERPDYFPLLIEFWGHAIRQPALRERLAERFADLRDGTTRIVAESARTQGFPVDRTASRYMAMLINALGNGLALEKLVDPDAVPDSLFGELLVLIVQSFGALAREHSNTMEGRDG